MKLVRGHSHSQASLFFQGSSVFLGGAGCAGLHVADPSISAPRGLAAENSLPCARRIITCSCVPVTLPSPLAGAVLALVTAQPWHPQGNGYGEADGRTFLVWELASSVPTTAREGVMVSVGASHQLTLNKSWLARDAEK